MFTPPALALDQTSKPTSVPMLLPKEHHGKTLKAINRNLSFEHFRRIELNDQFSEQIFKHYLDRLDPGKLYFTQGEITDFAQYALTFDEAIQEGDLSSAFAIFNVLQNRLVERYEWMMTAILHLKQADFKKHISLEVDRKNSPWPEDHKALVNLWRAHLLEASLRLMIADKDLTETKKVLTKRFHSKLSHLKQTNSEDAFQIFVNSFAELYDPHTQYLSPKASDNFDINMSLSLEGIGAVLQSDDEYTQVVRLVPGGPADKSGVIQPMDKIIAVGQNRNKMVDIVGWRIDEVVTLVRGPKGSNVYLEILRGEQSKPEVITIKRNTVKLEDQAARSQLYQVPLAKGNKQLPIGVINIPAFYADFRGRRSGNSHYRRVSDDVARQINELKKDDIQGLVLDLRSNGGGSLQEANRMIGLFLKTGPTVQIKNTRNKISLNKDEDPQIVFDKPIVVLIDRLSASASEIFAGAIQDYQRGLIVGSRSFGKGTVQVLRKLDYGQLKITHAKFYRISGGSNQHQGIIPDISMVSVYDPEIVGESSLDKALPWDTIVPAEYNPFYNLKSYLPQLQARHDARMLDNANYTHLKGVIDLQNSNDSNEIIVNLQERLQKLEDNKNKQLSLENNRRKQQNLKQFKTYADFEADIAEQKAEQEVVIKKDDPVMIEATEILADLIELEHKKMISANKKTDNQSNLFEFFGEMLN